MIINLNKKELIDAVITTARFSERRSATLPVLGSIVVEAGSDGIHFRATNLEVGIDLKVEGTVEKEGNVALPAQVLREIVSSLSPNGSVKLTQKDDVVVLSGDGVKSTLKTMSSEDFPSLPAPEESKIHLPLSGTLLKSLVGMVAPYASTSTVRPELASVLISAEGGVVKAVATDSFRLAEKKISVQGSVSPFSLLIPAKNAQSIVETIPDSEVILTADEHQCALSWASGVVITRLVSVAYPDYAQIIPKNFIGHATVLRKDFEAALRRASIFSDAFQKVRLGFDTGNKHLALSSRNNDVGESSEEIKGSVSGESIELSFNHRYLQAPLSSLAQESITLSSSGIGRPLVIRGVGDESFLYLVMPMNQ